MTLHLNYPWEYHVQVLFVFANLAVFHRFFSSHCILISLNSQYLSSNCQTHSLELSIRQLTPMLKLRLVSFEENRLPDDFIHDGVAGIHLYYLPCKHTWKAHCDTAP